MDHLWVGRNLKELWQEKFKDILTSARHQTVVAATPQQREWLKEWIVATTGGTWGWEIVTRAQLERRDATLGEWEIEQIARLVAPASLWSALPHWSQETVQWLRAGYRIDEIPFPATLQKVSEAVFAKIKNVGLRVTGQNPIRADIALGFDPLDTFGLSADTWGLIVEGELPSVPQTNALGVLEKTHGPARWCDLGPVQPLPALQVSAARHLLPATVQQLSQRTHLRRIVYQGALAQAAVADLFPALPLRPSPGVGWHLREWRQRYYKAEAAPTSFTARLQLDRHRRAQGQLDAEAQKKNEKESAARWEREGQLPASSGTLPAAGTPAEFFSLTGPHSRATYERFLPLGHFFADGKITKELWLEALRPAQKNTSYSGGLPVISFEDSLGLIDDETLVVWSQTPVAKDESLVYIRHIEEKNKPYTREKETLAHGYLQFDSHRALYARKSQALALSAWVALHSAGLHHERPVTDVAFSLASASASSAPGLQVKHTTRQNTKAPFSIYDYALPTPVKISCKQWEGAITCPELAWYEVIKLYPVWNPGDDNPQALWVGNWVHSALKTGGTPQAVDAFFQNLHAPQAQLSWREAHARAWSIAREFAVALGASGARTVEVEKPVSGTLKINKTEIPLTGRIDRTVQLADGTLLIIDFKTSSSATALTDKKLDAGDGLQLWLYRQLVSSNKTVALCRLSQGDAVEPQVFVAGQSLSVAPLMENIFQTGVLGQRAQLWGRFGAGERLPLATLPVQREVIEKRRKESYGNSR